MRVLVGLACVAVIAFVGYFFWGEWQKADAPRQAEIAFQHDCHRAAGELVAILGTSRAFDANPSLQETINLCSEKYGHNWANTADPALLALQAEGAARAD